MRVVLQSVRSSPEFCHGLTQAQAWTMMIMLLFPAPFLTAQTRKSTPAPETRPAAVTPLEAYRLAVKEQSSLAVTTVEKYRDSLVVDLAGSSGSARRVFMHFSDSIAARLADSVNLPRRISFDNVRERLARAAAMSADQHLLALRTLARRSQEVILGSVVAAAACVGCREGDDYDVRRARFTDWCDSTRDAAVDTLNARAQEARDAISEEYVNARDSVGEIVENLLDAENDEREARADSLAQEDEIASRLIVTVTYDNPVADRGRDNGVRVFGVSPSVDYRHRSGLFATLSGSWLDKANDNWDATATSVGYERAIGGDWYGSLAYTRLWFSSSSPQAKSVLDNILEGEIGWSGTVLSASAHLSYAFSKTSEATLFLDATAPLTLLETAGGGSLVFEPGLTGAYGQQDPSLEVARRRKANKLTGLTATGKVKKPFAVLDYEVSLPLTYRKGAYSFAATYAIIAPLNIVDASTSTVFGSFTVEFSVTIR